MDRASARRAIAKSLQTPDAARGAVVRVTIANRDQAWNADVWMYGPRGSGERGVRGTSCKQVAEAVTLIVAMALDAAYVAEPRDENPAAGATPPVEPDATPELELGVTAGADTGSLSGLTAGFGLSFSVVLARWRLEAYGTAWLPRSTPGGPIAGAGGSIGLYAGGLRAYFDALAADSGRLTLGPCLSAEAGSAVGQGYGVAEPDNAANFWGAGAAGISLRYLGVGAIRVGLLTELGMPFRRPVWQINDVPVFQTAQWFGRASIRIVYLFR